MSLAASLLPLLLVALPQAPKPTEPTAPPVQAAPKAQPAPPKPAAESGQQPSLSFFSRKFTFKWDQLIPLDVEVDGLRINSIFFNRRAFKSGLLKGADFGTRAQVEVTNTAKASRVPGFAVAVFDGENRLLGVATGGTSLGSVRSGETETFDLSFHQVVERLPKGEYFHLSVELSE